MNRAGWLGRRLILCALAAVPAAPAVRADTASVDLLFPPPSGQTNTLTIRVTAQAYGTVRSDTDTTTVTGNALSVLTFNLDATTCEATVTGLEFTGGTTVDPSVTMAADSTWTVGSGNTLNVVGALDGGGWALTKTGPGTLGLTGARNLAALDLDEGTARLTDGASDGLVTEALSVGPTAVLDLADGALVVDYGGGGWHDSTSWNPRFEPGCIPVPDCSCGSCAPTMDEGEHRWVTR